MDPDITLSRPGARCPHGHGWQCRPYRSPCLPSAHSPQTPTMSPMAAQTMDIHLPFGGALGHRHQPRSQQERGPRHGPGHQPGSGPHHSLLTSPCFILTWSLQSQPSPRSINPLASLSLPSLHCAFHLSHLSIHHTSVHCSSAHGRRLGVFLPATLVCVASALIVIFVLILSQIVFVFVVDKHIKYILY